MTSLSSKEEEKKGYGYGELFLPLQAKFQFKTRISYINKNNKWPTKLLSSLIRDHDIVKKKEMGKIFLILYNSFNEQ